jgi:N-carbamoyl-L-amino-acid hydrolase
MATGALLVGAPPGLRHSTGADRWGRLTKAIAQTSQDPLVDGTRLNRRLAELARFGGTPEGGTNRPAYSDADLAAREWVTERLREAGVDVGTDVAGNLIGTREGESTAGTPLMLGSHIDSVPSGGNYDGQVGAIAALEVAATLADAGHRTRHPLEFAIWANEEGGKTGSRAVAGEVAPAELALETASGFTIADGTRRIGGDPSRLTEARRQPGSIAAYLELHVEQGAVLDRDGIAIGVVEGIVGIKRWNVTVSGFANHAGTTPMDQRRDAMVAAARIIDAVNRIAVETPGRQVATVGRLEAHPGAPNVVPGRVTFTLESRDLDMDKIDAVFEAIRVRAGEIVGASDTSVAFEQYYVSRAAPTDPGLRDVIEAEAHGLELTTLRMPSGAGHDAQSIALLGPVGMIFVPSKDGISHSPLEYTAPEEITAGANVLLRALLAVDESGI